jgi:segregation and condensation protein B
MSDVDNKVKMIVEGLLLAAGRPLTLDNIIQVFSDDEKPDRKELKAVMDNIAEDCNDRGFELKEVASGFRFQVKQELSEWVGKLWEERPPRYTRALLETLALIAYRQPITRGDIEEIRGVGVSSNITRTLLDREWIRVVGHRDVPGRPAMFATTKQFLDYFNLKSLQDLPPLSEIKDLVKDNPELNLEDDLADQRILELPEEVVDENSIELSDAEKADLIAEEEAVALSKKPLDEILQLPPELQDPAELGDEADEEDDEDIEFSEEFGLKELDDTLDSLEAADDELAEVKTASEGEAEPAVNAEDEELLTGEDSEEVEFDAGENPGNT